MDNEKTAVGPAYDPSGVGQANGNLFSLPHSRHDAAVILLPVPWDVTTSYRPGTATGPEAILRASGQLDLSDLVFGQKIWEYGACMLPVKAEWQALNRALRPVAEACIAWCEAGEPDDQAEDMAAKTEAVNRGCESVMEGVLQETTALLESGKTVGLVGGDHSTPLGFLEACAQHFGEFGILQIDAHADLRIAYENFRYSHASIFHNALHLPAVKKLVQVGLRDLSPDETARINEDPRLHGFPDWHLRQALLEGMAWDELCRQIVDKLPRQVYVSVDIDGLDPALCPNTGTPVPGGLSFNEWLYLMKVLVDSGRRIIGFDLCEVSPSPAGGDEWDANVGARVLFHLCNAAMASRRAG